MKKVVFTTSGGDLGSPLDPRFGRAPNFLVYDLERDTFEVVDNASNVSSAQGAGIRAAETVVRLGATALVTGHCGPNAFRVLTAGGVSIFTSDAKTVGEALAAFRAGKLAESKGSDVQGHWR